MDRHQSLLKHLATIASPEIATTYLKKYESTPWYLRDKVTNNYWYRYSGRIAQYEQQIATMAPGTEVTVTIENKPTRRGLRPQKIVKLEKIWTPPPPLTGAHILHYYMYPENHQKGNLRMIPSITNRGLPAQGEQAEKVDLILKARARSDQKYKLILSTRRYTEGSDYDPISPNTVYVIEFVKAVPITPKDKRNRFWSYFVKPEAADRHTAYYKFFKPNETIPKVTQTCFFDCLDDFGYDGKHIMHPLKAVKTDTISTFCKRLNINIRLYNLNKTYTRYTSAPYTDYGEIDAPLVKMAQKHGHYFSLKKRGSLRYLHDLDMDDFIQMSTDQIRNIWKHVKDGKRDDKLTAENITRSYTRDSLPQVPKIQTSHIMVCDFECIVTGTANNQHQPYCLIIKDINPIPLTEEESIGANGEEVIPTVQSKVIYGVDIVKRFADFLKCNFDRDIIMYAHNAGRYDSLFFKCDCSFVKAGETIINGCVLALKLKYQGKDGRYHKLEIRDSYRLISAPLCKFSEMFKLPSGKGIYPYKYYTTETLFSIVPVDAVQEEHNFKRVEYRELEGDTFDARRFAIKYCQQDVDILRAGLMKFAESIQQEFGLNAYNYLTISSIAHEIMLKNGVYDNVPRIATGTPLSNFMRQSLVGGRVLVGSRDYYVHPEYDFLISKVGEKYELTEEQYNECITDFDAVSLYPSAMVRAKYPAGDIHLLESAEEFEDIRSQNALFYARIKFTPKKRVNFPQTYEQLETGKQFTNKEVTMVVDNNTFNDILKLQEADYQFIEGIYFDDETDKHISVIQNLFNLRAKYKRENNPTQNVIKLLLNSVYGKSILNYEKMRSIKYKYSEDKVNNYVRNNLYLIRGDITKCGAAYRIVTKHINKKGYDYNHLSVGLSVLSMSKTIMREVMELVDDAVMYQDTDSMHLKVSELNRLQTQFSERYGRELVGSALGQFHSDFSVGDFKKCGKYPIIAIKTIIIGKKCYLDELLYTDKDGVLRLGYHKRMKGVSSAVVDPAVYQRLYNGEKIAIDLVSDATPQFDVDQTTGEIFSKSTFIRTMSASNGRAT